MYLNQNGGYAETFQQSDECARTPVLSVDFNAIRLSLVDGHVHEHAVLHGTGAQVLLSVQKLDL